MALPHAHTNTYIHTHAHIHTRTNTHTYTQNTHLNAHKHGETGPLRGSLILQNLQQVPPALTAADLLHHQVLFICQLLFSCLLVLVLHRSVHTHTGKGEDTHIQETDSLSALSKCLYFLVQHILTHTYSYTHLHTHTQTHALTQTHG
jgi:hypothetical protein